MLKVRQFLALATLTAAETIRQPICILLASACILCTALVPMILLFTFGEDGKIARESGLAFHLLFGLFIAGHAASSSLASEIESGTASAVLSKPVSRELFFLAKFAGIVAIMLSFSVCAAVATLISVRVSETFLETGPILGYVTDWQAGMMLAATPFAAYFVGGLVNFKTHRSFGASSFILLVLFVVAAALLCGFFNRAGDWQPYNLDVEWRILPASILVTFALIIFAAISLTLSTRLEMTPTLTITFSILLLGLFSDYMLGRQIASSYLAGFLYALIPNWQQFWLSDALNRNGTIPVAYVVSAGSYAITYSAAVLSIGMISFRNVDMK